MTPNPALQRTPPASPLAPLSFKPLGRMKYLLGLLFLACAAPVIANKPAPLPTMQSLAGAWVGVGEMGMDFYRLELTQDGTGVLASLSEYGSEPKPQLYRVEKWSILKRRIAIKLTSETFPGKESLSVSGDVVGESLGLRVKALYKNGSGRWDLRCFRELPAIKSLDVLREAMKQRQAKGKL